MTQNRTLTDEQLEFFHREGYLVLRGFLSRGEAAEWAQHFMDLHAQGPVEGYFSPHTVEEAKGDLLKAYPRMLFPNRWDPASHSYMLDARLEPVLHDLLGEEPLAAQSMFYFKP